MRRLAFAMTLLLAACGAGDPPGQENAASEPPTATPAPGNAGQVQQDPGADEGDAAAPQRAGPTSACLIQDGERIPENALHGIGTEPFWAVDVKGRCVTYSTPENQAGTRIWTQFVGTRDNGRWTGALDNQRFVMVTEPQPGCSDGMSDNRYPIAVTLTVRGERRTGCAEPR